MSIAPAKAPKTDLWHYRLTVEQYLKMIETGVFSGGGHVELLGGLLVNKMTKHEPHNFSVRSLGNLLRALIPADWLVSEEKSVVIGKHWRPEPDIAVIRGPNDRYRAEAPKAEDIAMLAEIADSSYSIDRGRKWRRYAACGVPSYWIVNIPGRIVEVYSDPAAEGGTGRYRDTKSFGPEEEVPLVIDGRELGRVAVRDLLP